MRFPVAGVIFSEPTFIVVFWFINNFQPNSLWADKISEPYNEKLDKEQRIKEGRKERIPNLR